MAEAPLDLLIMMKVYMAHQGDGIYVPAEDDKIHRIIEEIGEGRRLTSAELTSAASAAFRWYDEALSLGTDGLRVRFEMAVRQVADVIAEQPECKRWVCDYLIDVAQADKAITPGETEILHFVEDAFGIPRTPVAT